MPIIELQRRMVERGRIRAGDRQAYTDSKGETKYRANKLDKWRLTSKDVQTLEQAARLWGGKVREWEGHEGEFELYTDVDALPIMLLPGHVPTTWYELWSKGGCQRRCDGVHETISDSSCLCGEERECKPTTRLSVLLPDLPGIGSWLLSSTGWNAAAELAGAADLLSRASAQGVLIPARLRLEQRVQVTGGQTRRFAVPVIDLDVSMRELLGAQGALTDGSGMRALPQGYVPIQGNGDNGPTLAEGLAVAETQQVTRTPRSAAPIPVPEDEIEFGDAPVVVSDEPGASSPPLASGTSLPEEPRAPQALSPAEHKQKLNALVGQLRGAGTITTEQLYVAVAKSRDVEVDTLPRGASGAIRWSMLRDDLTEAELADLHARLGKLWATTQGDAA